MGEENKSPKDAMLGVFKSLAYWNGVVKGFLLPPIKALVDSTDNKWDDSLYAMGVGFIDKLLPPGKVD